MSDNKLVLTEADGASAKPWRGPSASKVVAVKPHRVFRDEPDGINDREIEIWYNDNWVPAFFSDIKAGDFYLMDPLKHTHREDQCFFAASDCKYSYMMNRYSENLGPKTFIISQGSQIVQAPKLPERTINELEHKADDNRGKLDDRERDVHTLALGHSNRL